MKKQSAKKNYIYNVLYQILIIIIPIITTPYLARTLGVNCNGIYGYTVSIVTYFILFGSMGISLYGQREIAYNQNSKKKASKVFWELLFLKTITLLISLIIYFLFFAIKGIYSIYFRILIIELVGNILDISWLYQGYEDFKTLVIRNIIIKMISLICIFVFIKNAGDTWKYVLIHSLSIFIANGALWFALKRYIEKPNFKNVDLLCHIKPAILLFIPQVAIQVYAVLDKTMIGAITHSMQEVGYYEQSQKILKLLLSIITALGTVMLPRVAASFAEGNHKKIKNYIIKSMQFSFFLSLPVTAGIALVSNNFIPLFLGNGYDKAKIIFPLMSPIILFISLSSITGNQYLLPVKRQKEYTISVLIGAFINALLNFILIKHYQSLGACIATIVAELCVTITQLYFIRKEFAIKEILLLAKNYFIATIIMFAITYQIQLLRLSGFITISLQVILGVTIYGLILILLRDKLVYEIIDDIKRVVKKK